jgi:hypothetical protein
MSLLHSIGFLAVIAVLVYLLLSYFDSRQESDHEFKELSKYNDKCRKLTSEQFIPKKKLEYRELEKRMKQILKDPREVENALENKAKEKENDKINEQRKRDRRKIAYKYENELFEIFGTSYEITESQLLDGIKAKFRLNQEEAYELINSLNAELILMSGTTKCTLGPALTYDALCIDENDMSFDKWLRQQQE